MTHQGIGGLRTDGHLRVVLQGLNQGLPTGSCGLVAKARATELTQDHVVLLKPQQQQRLSVFRAGIHQAG